MNSENLNKAIKLLSIKSRRRVSDLFSGEYSSYFRGSGIEFEEYRDYVPGDDVRRIDWMVTARRDRPYVRLFREERERTLYFLVDVSSSMSFGSGQNKKQAAAEIVSLLSLAATRAHDKVGLVLFSDRIEHFEPPRRSQNISWKILEQILSVQPQGRKTVLSVALDFLMKVTKRRSVAVLLSDFLFDEVPERSLRIAARRHEFTLIRVLDRLEFPFPRGYLVGCRDMEEGVVEDIDSDLFQEKKTVEMLIPDWIPESLRAHWIDVSTHEDVLRKLILGLSVVR